MIFGSAGISLFKSLWLGLMSIESESLWFQITICFAPNSFNFKIISALSIFGTFVASKVFNFTFLCAIPRHAPVGKILSPSVKEAKAPDVSWWDYVTTIPPDIATFPNSSVVNKAYVETIHVGRCVFISHRFGGMPYTEAIEFIRRLIS